MFSLLKASAFTLALSLTAVTASTLQPRQSDDDVDQSKAVSQANPFSDQNAFKISNSYIGCGLPGDETCSYDFEVKGNENYDLPGFTAHCAQRVGTFDSQYRQCDLTGADSARLRGRNVQAVWAFAYIDPSNENWSYVYVALQFTNPRNRGQSETWVGYQYGTYRDFSESLTDYTVIPQRS